jgi:L-rhamnose mutarotase
MEAEYRRRRRDLAEMLAMLRDAGISDYSIFLDRETDTLLPSAPDGEPRMDALAKIGRLLE